MAAAVDTTRLLQFVIAGNAGDSLVYYEGFLGRDRANGNISTLDSMMCRSALELCFDGLITLTQRRLTDENYQYIAVISKSQKQVKNGSD